MSLEGYEGLIVETLSKCMNFTVEVIDCAMVWGSKQVDGNWTGLVGAVYEGVGLMNHKFGLYMIVFVSQREPT